MISPTPPTGTVAPSRPRLSLAASRDLTALIVAHPGADHERLAQLYRLITGKVISSRKVGSHTRRLDLTSGLECGKGGAA